MSIEFTFLPHGESILIESDGFNMLIDGGHSDPLFVLQGLRGNIPRIDGIVITHIDQDHILGIINLLKQPYYEESIKNIKFIAFNEPDDSKLFSKPEISKKSSVTQGENLKDIVDIYKIPHKNKIHIEDKNSFSFFNEEVKGFQVSLLTPNKKNLDKLFNKWKKDKFYKEKYSSSEKPQAARVDELADGNWKDTSITNGSSISFLVSHENKNFLLLGDAHIDQVVKSLMENHNATEKNPLQLEFVKLSHHGSKGNISDDFLKIIKTNTYIICKPSENYSKLPDGETIAKIVKYGKRSASQEIKFFYTGDFRKNVQFHESDKKQYNFSFYPCDSKSFYFK